MNEYSVAGFVDCLTSSMCRKMAGKELEWTQKFDRLCNELNKFGLLDQMDILGEIYTMPACLVCTEETLLKFLSLVCAEICSINESIERKFLVLCLFLMVITDVSFKLQCYRLITNMKMVLTLKLQTKLALNYNVNEGIRNLEDHCLLLLIQERDWALRQYRQLRGIIRTVKESLCSYLPRQPEVSKLLETPVFVMCKFCFTNCKELLETIMNF